MLYACYGTGRATGAEAALVRKLRADFERALASYPDFTEWRFVTNAAVGPKAAAALLEIQRGHSHESARPLTAAIWGVDHLWENVLTALPEARLAALYGAPPTMQRMVPQQLRARGHSFVNRKKELVALDGVLDRATRADRPSVAILHGGHGAGKTAIGEYWSWQHQDRFASGQIVVDYGEIRRAGLVSPSEVLRVVLRDLGYSPAEIPDGLERRTAFYRSVTAQSHRQLLVVLDDVETSAQVRPLIPNSSAAAVLVTTRATLEDLLGDVAEGVEIQRLQPEKAEHLLEELIGADRVLAEPAAVALLLAFCDGLPLAITIVAARLRADETREVRELVASLEVESTRLRRLGFRDGVSLEAVWDDAYRQLTAQEALAYRRLGQHPALSFTLESAAAAIGVPVDTVGELLDVLRDRHLLESTPGRPRRYRYHDLLRLHARRTGGEADGLDSRRHVAEGVAEHYVALCGGLDRALTATRLRLAPEPRPLGDPPAGPALARARFQAERSSILSVLDSARASGLNRQVWSIAESLWPLYNGQGLSEEAATVFGLGADAAADDGRGDAAARLWGLVARMRLETGDLAEARTAIARAWDAFGQGGDMGVEGTLCEISGILHSDAGDPKGALEMFGRARDLCVQQGNPRGIAIQDYLIGKAHADLDEWEQALIALSSSAAAVEELDDRVLLARVAFHFARALEHTESEPEAYAEYERSAELAAFAGNLSYEARANEALAEIAQHRGDAAAARDYFLRSAALLRLRDADHAAVLEERARLILS